MRPRPTSPLHNLADQEFDVVVVGAGITGACIALDAASRGLRTALIDRADFGSGATTNCLRIVHGGLRYLQHLDLRRSRESIVERSMWLRSAPHLVEPLPVVMPTTNGRFPGRRTLAAGLALNEALSADRNDGIESDRQIPKSRVLSLDECAHLAPDAMAAGVNGGILFHDAIMYSPDRLTLEVIEAARRAGVTTGNYVEFVMAHDADGTVTGCTLRDALRGEDCVVRTRWIVNATGAAATDVAQALGPSNPVTRQAYSIAMNFVTGPDSSSAAFTVTGGAADPDRRLGAGGRQLFIVPWRGQRLIGTAHFPWQGSTLSPSLPDEYVDRFLAELRSATPAMPVGQDDVRVVNWGLLPVSETRPDSRIRLLKHHRILDHGTTGGLRGAISVVSVKFTTARRLAEEVVDRLTPNRPTHPDPLALPLPGRPAESYSALLRGALSQHGNLPSDVVEHLVRCYGANYERVIALGQSVDRGWERVVPDAPVIQAQFLYGVRDEQARTADDLLWRRTELGPRGLVTPDARAMAEQAISAVP